ncbi:NYN domain-containing protein [Klebsiella pneumoniae]|uniref:NYN domain-containing protein n=1 Tax=Klebsiella pneumoniae TaxID=573 RepID=UPI001D0EEE10
MLVSGDGDFEPLVTRIAQRFQVKVEVYGVPKLTAQHLIDVASQFHPIEHRLLL